MKKEVVEQCYLEKEGDTGCSLKFSWKILIFIFLMVFVLNFIYANPSFSDSQVSTNNTVAGQITQFAINVTDGSALHPDGQYIFSTNNTGSWINESAVNFTTTPSRVYTTKILNSTIGTLVDYRWYFSDNAGNTNSTPIYELTTTFPPQAIDFKMCLVRNQQLNNSLSLANSAKLIISAKNGQVLTVNNLPDYDQFDESGWIAMLSNGTGTEGVADGDYLYKNSAIINRTAKTLTFETSINLSLWNVGYILVLYNPFLNYDFVGNQVYAPFISVTGAPEWRDGGGTTGSVGGPIFRHSDGRYIWMFNGFTGTVYKLGYAYSNDMLTWTIGNSDQPVYNYTDQMPGISNAFAAGPAIPLNDGTERYYSLVSQTRSSDGHGVIRILYFDENLTTFTYSTPIIADAELGYYGGNILKIGDYYHLITIFLASAGASYRTVTVAKSTNLEGPYIIYQNITRGIDSNDGTAWSNNVDAPSIYNDGTKIFGLFGGTSRWSQSGTKGNREYSLLDFNEQTEVWSINDKGPAFVNPLYFQDLGSDGDYYFWAGDHVGAQPSIFIDGNDSYISLSMKGDKYQVALIKLKESTPSTYSQNSTNNTVAGEITNFAININDNVALHSNGAYIFSTNNSGNWVNDSLVLFSTTPSWANVTKILNSTIGTLISYMWYFDDNSSNSNFTPVYVLTTTEGVDLTPSYFTTIPANSSLFYGNESLSVDFDADDETSFGYFSVNDTARFSITQAGLLTNATPMAVGNYEINVTINDSANNINWTRYTVQINKSNYYDCGIYFNASSGINYPDTFLVWSNCTTPVTLMRNGTTVGNNTVVNSGASAYNFSFLRTDTQNYSYIYNESQFIINKVTPTLTKKLNGADSDFTGVYPIQVNASGYTNYGTLAMSRNGTNILTQNNLNLSLPSGYHQFAFSITGNANITDIANQYLYATINQNTTSCSVYFNTTSPIIHPAFFMAYANCSSDYTLTDNGTAIINETAINSGATAYNISVQRSDTSNYTNTVNEQQFIISKSSENCQVLFNETSPINYPKTFLAWTNCTTEFTLKRNTTVITNNTEQVLTVGAYNFSFLRTDSTNYSIYYNQSEFRVVDLTPSTYSHSSTNNTLAGLFTQFAINVDDNVALNPDGQYIFSTNNTGSWVNDSDINFTTTPSWANVTKILNTTIGTLVDYRWYFSDNAGITNSTSIYVLTTTDGTPSIVSIILPTSGQVFTTSSVSLEIRTNENSTCNYSIDSGTTNYSMTANSTDTGFTASKILDNGDYTVNYYCSDIFGNLNNSEGVSFSVSASSSTNFLGGSVTYKLTHKQLDKGYEMILTKKQKIQINLSNNENYTTKIEEINKTQNKVIISISGINYSIIGNSSEKINLNEDGYYDLEISIIQIYNAGYAKFEFKEIHEEIPRENKESVTEKVIDNNKNTTKENINLIYYIFGFVVLALIVSIIFRKVKRKKI